MQVAAGSDSQVVNNLSLKKVQDRISYMAYKDPEVQAAYMREWIRKRREKWLAENGPCPCGSWDNLTVDHVNPETKVNHRVWSWSKERRDEELAKCQVLCFSCHKEKTRVENTQRFTFEHGQAKWGRRHCNCSSCKARNAEAQRTRRAQMAKRVKATAL